MKALPVCGELETGSAKGFSEGTPKPYQEFLESLLAWRDVSIIVAEHVETQVPETQVLIMVLLGQNKIERMTNIKWRQILIGLTLRLTKLSIEPLSVLPKKG